MLTEVTTRLIDLDRQVNWQTALIQELKERLDPGSAGYLRAQADVREAKATLANLLIAMNEARADQKAIIVKLTGLCVLLDTRPDWTRPRSAA